MIGATMIGSSFPAELIAKATLVIVLVALVQRALMRRGSAATRHLVLGMALGALLLLPALSLLLPSWRIPVRTDPQGPSVSTTAPVEHVAASPSIFETADVPVATAASEPEAAGVTVARVGPIRGELTTAWKRVSPLTLAWTTYLLVLAALLARIGRQWLALRRLRARTEVVTDPEWLALLEEVAVTLGPAARATLVRSRVSLVPMTWGTLSPVVLVPAEADEWPLEQRRSVLLHELAHVVRRDSLVQTLGSLATAVYWFHPGVWWTARRLRVERELACDDHVLRAGAPAHDYAGHLLEIARTLRAPRNLALALSMARPSQLEGRMISILDGARRRGAPGRRSIKGWLLASAVTVGTLASAGLSGVEGSSASSITEVPVEVMDVVAAGETLGATLRGDLQLPDGSATRQAGVAEIAAGGDARVVLTSRDGRTRVTLTPTMIAVGHPDREAPITVFGAERRALGAEEALNSILGPIGFMLVDLRDVRYEAGTLTLVTREAPEPARFNASGNQRGVFTVEGMGLSSAEVESFVRLARSRIAEIEENLVGDRTRFIESVAAELEGEQARVGRESSATAAQVSAAESTLRTLLGTLEKATQATGTITGTVTDQAGNPVLGVRVWAVGTGRTAPTGTDGRYTITGVPTGTRQLRTEGEGFAHAVRNVAVTAGQTTTADLQVAQALTITGSTDRAAAATTTGFTGSRTPEEQRRAEIERWLHAEQQRVSTEPGFPLVEPFKRVTRAWRAYEAWRTIGGEARRLEELDRAFRSSVERYIEILESQGS